MSRRPSIFAHANGFLSMERWIPVEIYMSSIDDSGRVLGTAVDLRHVVFPAEDNNYNRLLSKYRSGIYYPPNFEGMQSAALPEYLKQVHAELGGGIVAVRDYDLKFYLEFAGVRPVVNTWAMTPRMVELIDVPESPADIHPNVHRQNASQFCSKVLAWKYAQFFKYLLEE